MDRTMYNQFPHDVESNLSLNDKLSLIKLITQHDEYDQ